MKPEMNPIQQTSIETNKPRILLPKVFGKMLRKPKFVISLSIIVLIYGLGISAPLVAPQSYYEQNLSQSKISPNRNHILGTDFLGRDVASRLIYSLRTNLIITFAAVITGSLFIGVALGLIAGYFGGRIDSVIMRVGDVFLAFPGLLLVILLAATLRPRIIEMVRSFENIFGLNGLVRWGIPDYLLIFGALAAFSWVGIARLTRGQVLSLKRTVYVEAAEALGASPTHILLKHILPNALPPIIVVITMGMGTLAGAEVMLSWLGIGIQPPAPSLGNMIREGQDISILRNYPHLLIPPVIIVGLLIFSWNMLGDALNDLWNPKIR